MPLTSLQLELRGLYPAAAMATEDYVPTFEVSSPCHDNPFINAVVGRFQRVVEEDTLGRSCYVNVSAVGGRSLYMWFCDKSQGWVITFDDWQPLAWGPHGADRDTPSLVGWHAPVVSAQSQLMQCLYVGMQDTMGNTLPDDAQAAPAGEAPAGEEDLLDAAASAGDDDPIGDEDNAEVYERDELDAEPQQLVPRPPAWPPSRRSVKNLLDRPRPKHPKRPRSPTPPPPPPPPRRSAPAGAAPPPQPKKQQKKQQKGVGGIGHDGNPTYEKGGFSSAQACRQAIKEKSNDSDALRKAGGWFDKAQALIELLVIDDGVVAAKRLTGRLWGPF